MEDRLCLFIPHSHPLPLFLLASLLVTQQLDFMRLWKKIVFIVIVTVWWQLSLQVAFAFSNMVTYAKFSGLKGRSHRLRDYIFKMNLLYLMCTKVLYFLFFFHPYLSCTLDVNEYGFQTAALCDWHNRWKNQRGYDIRKFHVICYF